MNATIQIAQVLNVSPNQIKSVREMAWVYCVVVFGQRATFVSKKKVEAKMINYTESGTLHDGRLFVSGDELTAVLERQGANALYYNPLSWDAAANKWIGFNGWRSFDSMDRAISEFSSSPKIAAKIPAGYMMTSTGEIVLEADWDEIEGSM